MGQAARSAARFSAVNVSAERYHTAVCCVDVRRIDARLPLELVEDDLLHAAMCCDRLAFVVEPVLGSRIASDRLSPTDVCCLQDA